MTQWAWKQNATCCIEAIKNGEETSELFARSWRTRVSPLFWRIPILLWAIIIVSWSGASFWGRSEKFFLYMTHWGLLLIMLESIFGIAVAIKKRHDELPVFDWPSASFAIVQVTGCMMRCVQCLKYQCQWRMCALEHPSPSNFYVSCWQGNRSCVRLLLLRSFLFLFSTCVLITCMVLTPLTFDISYKYWFIYLTHWSFLLIVLTTGFATAISAYVYFEKPIDATFGLPWYVKTYWVLYNITIPVAFLITVFYWGILKTSGKMIRYAPNPVLDAMLHGVNSLVMFIELIFSAHPSRLLHIMQPLFFALAYLLFTVIYYCAGGLDPWGNPFIYPVIDWSKPQQTMVVVTLTALFLALMHLIVVAVAAVRDVISRRCLRDTTGVYNDGFGA